MKPYLTVLKTGYAEQTIERSRFIGHVFPAKTVAECEGFFAAIRKDHRQATHNVPAYVLGDAFQSQWASDDGEPHGTSGAPIVYMLVGEGISDVCVMVTRYFGGLKLGTGGLVRAYTGTARMALIAAGLGRVSEKLMLVFETDYPGHNRIKAAAGAADAVGTEPGKNAALNRPSFIINSTEYTDKVKVTLACEPDDRDKTLRDVREIHPGIRLVSERTETVTIRLPAEDGKRR